MRIDNQSQQALDRVRPLVDYVTRECSSSKRARLVLAERKLPGWISGGRTERSVVMDGRSWSRVTLWLSRGMTYPHRERFLPEVPAVRLASFEEEVVFVLAHELRHVDQMWAPDLRDTRWKSLRAVEIDAELFGHRMLNGYRAALLEHGSLDLALKNEAVVRNVPPLLSLCH